MNTKYDITELLEHFRDDQDVMRSTRSQYYNVIRLFFRWLEIEGEKWQDIGIAQIIRYKDQLFDSGKTIRTIRFYLVIIKIFFKWMATNGICRNFASDIKLPKKQNTFSRLALTREQVHSFISAIDISTQIGKRDYALFSLLFTTGLRSVSVEKMNIGDIKQYQGELVIWYQNKGSRQKDRFKPLAERCSEAIHDYLLSRPDIQDSWPLFISHSYNARGQRLSRRSMRTIFKKRLLNVGISNPRITLHSTRHTHGVLATKAVGAYETQISLGHASAQTTRIYNQNADEEIIFQNKTGKAIDEML